MADLRRRDDLDTVPTDEVENTSCLSRRKCWRIDVPLRVEAIMGTVDLRRLAFQVCGISLIKSRGMDTKLCRIFCLANISLCVEIAVPGGWQLLLIRMFRNRA